MTDTDQAASYQSPLYFEDLSEGMQAQLSNTITDDDVVGFAKISGDNNPVHLDDAYAATTRFKTRIAHGILSAGFISALIATKLPGPGCIYVSQNLRFKAPVYIGEEVTATVIIHKLIPEKGFVEFSTQCHVGELLVLDGEATVMVPKRLKNIS